MELRSRVVLVAALIVAMIAGMWGARVAARTFLSPLAGLERIAFAPKPAEPEPESDLESAIRSVDWDAPETAAALAEAPVVASPTRRAANQALRVVQLRQAAGELEAVLGQIETTEFELKVAFTDAVRTSASIALVLQPAEMNLETMASNLGLSDSQKARIESLFDWKRRALESLTEAEKADGAKSQRIEEAFHGAVARELDQTQAQEYEKSRTSGLQAYFQRAQFLTLKPETEKAVEPKLRWAVEWRSNQATESK